MTCTIQFVIIFHNLKETSREVVFLIPSPQIKCLIEVRSYLMVILLDTVKMKWLVKVLLMLILKGLLKERLVSSFIVREC